jgi:hypothetical protein
MPTIGEMYRTEKIEWRGKVLPLARPSFACEAAYRDYMEKEALAAIRRNTMGAAEYKLQAAVWQEQCAAHAYDWEQPAWNLSMGSRINRARWFWLVFNQAGPDGKAPVVEAVSLGEMDDLLVEKGDELAAAWVRLTGPQPDPQTPATGEPTPAAAA